MARSLSRRSILAAGVGASAVGPLRAFASRSAAAFPAPHHLLAERRILDVDGRAAPVLRVTNEGGGVGISLAPGERFRVTLTNALDEATIVNWHGQSPPWRQAGVPWPQVPPLAPGSARTYDYAPLAGTHYMHCFWGLGEQDLMTAPLIVRTAAEEREDRQEVVLLLNDFSFTAPDVLLAGLTGQTPAAVHAMTRQLENVPTPPEGEASGPAGMGGMMPGMGRMMGGRRGMGRMADLQTLTYDAFLANERTLRDPAVARVEPRGRLRLRVINASASSMFWIDLGDLQGMVVAADGHPVRPVPGRHFPLAIAQRLDILLDLPSAGAFPILAWLQGSRRRTGIVLASPGARIVRMAELGRGPAPPVDNSLEVRLSALTPLAERAADVSYRIVLSGGMMAFAWAMNGEYWPRITPLMLSRGQRVEIALLNHSMMQHPIHLLGHAFQVLAINGRPVAGAVRDTVLVEPMMGSVRIAFDADNPGRWPLLCHNLYHMMSGMMTELRYRGIAI